MAMHFSGEDSVIKTRKPYTITKERERWTDEEHNKFLEALKLYGRAWRRIEEHIGTKTAVQIRSHAQKFFAKLETKAHFKGIPKVEALDIDIPPPRPKRKATNPYPRKTRPASPTSQAEIRDEKPPTPRPSFQTKLILDFEKEQLHEQSIGEEQKTDENENHDNNSSEVGNLLHEESGPIYWTNTSFFSSMAALRNSCAFEGFFPSDKEVTDGDAKQLFQHNDISEFQNYYASVKQLDRAQSRPLQGYEILPTLNYPCYVAVNSLAGSLGISAQTSSPEIHLKENASSESQDNHMRCILQSSPDLQSPLIPLSHNPDDHRSFLDDHRPFLYSSPTFSNLISCALFPNPEAHAAASFGAALWPAESSVCHQRCFCCMQLNSSPCTADSSGLTVAAASSWWTTHGLLPLSVPSQAALNCAPSVGNPFTTDGEAKCFEKCQAQSLVFKPHLSTVFKESIDNNVNEAKECLDRGKGLLILEHDDLNMEKWRKQILRSSCGSYATSSNEVEKKKKGEEEPEGNTTSNEPANRKMESWKEVSQEAFQALFTREVSPQSFSPQQDPDTRETIEDVKHIEEDDVHLSLNIKSGSCPSSKINISLPGNENVREGKITIGLGQGKTNNRRTRFKPYKRCSIESAENRVATSKNYGEGKGPKRKPRRRHLLLDF